MICGGQAQGQESSEGLSVRLQHSAGQLGASPTRVLSKAFSLQERSPSSVNCDDAAEPIWDPVRAAGGIGLIAILIASAWLEWHFVKWIFTLLVG